MRPLVLVVLLALAGCDTNSSSNPDARLPDGGRDVAPPVDSGPDATAPAGWVVTTGGAGMEIAMNVIEESSGDILFAGKHNKPMTLLGETITPPGAATQFSATSFCADQSSDASGMFLARLDAAGTTLRWSTSLPAVIECPHWDGLGLDAAGNLYVSGSYSGTETFGSTTLTSSGSEEIFVAKLDPSGQVLWAVSAGGPGIDDANGLAVDAAGNVTVTGSFEGTASFGATSLTARGTYDAFVARLDPGGAFVWAVRAGGEKDAQLLTPWPFTDYGMAVALDSAGNAYVNGRYVLEASFGDGTPSVSVTAANAGAALVHDGFLAKLDPSGTFLWASAAKGSPAVTDVDLGRDSAGNLYVGGSAPGSGPVAAKVSSGGAYLWSTTISIPTPGDGWVQSLAVGTKDLVVAGTFKGTADFGAAGKLTARGEWDGFVTGLDLADGKPRWARQVGGSGANVRITAMRFDSGGAVLVVGGFKGTAAIGGMTVSSTGGWDAFLWKMIPPSP
jgi:hypothetical protein